MQNKTVWDNMALCGFTRTELPSTASKRCNLFVKQIQTLCVTVCSKYQL